MTTPKTRAMVESLGKRDIQRRKCTERGAQKEGTDGVYEEGEEGCGDEIGQSRLHCHADEDIAWLYAAITPKSKHMHRSRYRDGWHKEVWSARAWRRHADTGGSDPCAMHL
jgi:hypothetical protein